MRDVYDVGELEDALWLHKDCSGYAAERSLHRARCAIRDSFSISDCLE
jgi:hypothetical protein